MTDHLPARRRWSIWPRTIRGLAIAFACMSVIVTAVLGVATSVAVHREIELQIDQRIDTEAEALRDYEREHGFDALVDVVAQRDRRERPGSIGYLAAIDDPDGRMMGYIVTDRAGRRRAGSLRAELPPPGWSEFLRIRRPDGSLGDAQALNSPLRNGGRLVVAGDRREIHQMDRLLLRFFATAFGVLLLLGGMMALLFGGIIRRRLSALEQSARSIIAGDMTRRMPLDGSGIELDRLLILLNRMLDHIAGLVENLRSVSNGLAHDLRTPLSRLRVKLEQAAELSQNNDQRALLDAVAHESDELLHLLSSLLAIAEIDGKSIRSRFTAFDLTAAIVNIAEAHRASIEDAGMTLSIDDMPVRVLGDPALLQRLVGNLLDNILKHAGSATQVEIAIFIRDGGAVIRVADDGPGIPAGERKRVFERLVRLDISRSTPGHGLGLSMVTAIAAAHGGSVGIRPSDRGTLIEFEMPALA